MAIKMDGHTVTKLRLTDGAGNTVDKTLTEEGTIPTPTASVTITQNGTYPVADKATAVVNVPTGSDPVLEERTITENGEYTPGSGKDGFSRVVVDVPQEEPDLETLSVTENGNYTPSSGKDGFSEVSVDVPTPEPHLQDKTFTANGTYNAPSGYDGFGEVTVQVSGDAPTYQTKSVTPTGSAQTVEPDSGYDALSSVTVAAIPSEYVVPDGSLSITGNGTYDVSEKAEAVVNVPTGTARTSSDVTADGGTVSVPAGLYGSAVTKSVQTGTEGTPTATKGAVSNHAVTVTPRVTNTEGYISGGTQTGEGVSVSAAELVSGTLEITENTTGDGIDVTNYERVKANVPTGGGTDNWQYVVELNKTFRVAVLPETVTVNAPNCKVMNSTFGLATGAKHITVTVGTLTDMSYSVVGGSGSQYNNSIEDITINGAFRNCNFQEAFRNNSTLKAVNCELDFTGATNVANMWLNNASIESVQFKANSLSLDMTMAQSSHLTDASLVSIANSLVSTAAKTLTLHATPFTRCAAIMGTVSGGLFTADDGGTVALDDFITDVKGWTLTSA